MSRPSRLGLLVARAALGAVALTFGGCSSTRYEILSGPRDWTADPAIVEQDAPAVLYAMSDVHGGYGRMMALLAGSGLAEAAGAPSGARWTGGSAVLVVVGDLIDKGSESLHVIEALRALEGAAPAAGGRVIVTIGNHEAEFFADPWNHKAYASTGVDTELEGEDLTPLDLATGADSRGAWLRRLPFGARVGAWFFCHAGDTHGRSVAELEAALRGAIEENDYDDDEIIGSDSILVSTGWYSDHSGQSYARAVGAEHMVFGHDPSALAGKGVIGVVESGALMRIDCGMSPEVDYSTGKLLRVTRTGGQQVAESVDSAGTAVVLWSGAAP